jgi:hypothetical protein
MQADLNALNFAQLPCARLVQTTDGIAGCEVFFLTDHGYDAN